MFTGIIHSCVPAQLWHASATSHLSQESLLKVHLSSHPEQFTGISAKDSVAIDGICLTVVEVIPKEQCIVVGIASQTQKITDILKRVEQRENVHFERAMKLGDEFGGHYIQGHIHGKCELIHIAPGQHQDYHLTFQVCSQQQWKYLITKSYIAISGISLTIADCNAIKGIFSVNIIPETARRTHLIDHTSPCQITENSRIQLLEWDHLTVTIVDTLERMHQEGHLKAPS